MWCLRMLPLATMMDPVSDTVYSSSHSATDINLDVATSQPMKSVSLFMLLNYHSSAHLCWVWSAIMRWVCLFFWFFSPPSLSHTTKCALNLALDFKSAAPCLCPFRLSTENAESNSVCERDFFCGICLVGQHFSKEFWQVPHSSAIRESSVGLFTQIGSLIA